MTTNKQYLLDEGLKVLFASVGVDHAEILRRAGLPDDTLNRPNQRISSQEYWAFARALQDIVPSPLFPLQLVESITPDTFSPPVFAALCSPDLKTAISRLARFKPLLAPVRMEVETAGSAVRVDYHWLDSPMGSPSYHSGAEALFLVKLARMGTRQLVEAVDVTLSQFPVARAEFEAFLGCPIRLGSHLSVTFREEDARLPFLSHSGAMWEVFEPSLRQRLAELDGSASCTSRIRAVLLEALPSGQVSIAFVAGRMALHPRTLQRQIKAEGTTFKALVRETRESLANHYLKNTRFEFGEIAYLLGFDEPSSFFRAYQAWTGTTPGCARQSSR